MSDLQLLAPITKHEKLPDGRMMIEGVATSEDLDRQSEIIDYDTAKAAFATWGGNIREMHDPKKAVGRAVEYTAVDDSRQIVLKAYISAGAPDTQKKIEDGTLSMFSIGGKSKAKQAESVTKADGSKVNATRVLMDRISEVSVVDSGANPAAGFDVVKADGAVGEVLDGGEVETETEKADVGDDITKYLGDEAYDASRAIDALNTVYNLYGKESREMSEPPEQVAALKVVIEKLKEFIASEIAEPMESGNVMLSDQGGDIAKADSDAVDALAALLNEAKITPARLLELAKADADVDVEKAGARNSKADSDRIQSMHDHSAALGAKCGGMEKADTGDDVAKLEALQDDIAKVTAENDVLKADIAKAQARITELEAKPAPMKGPIRVVTKADDANPDPDAPDIEAEANRIAKADNPALELIKMVHQRPIRIA